MRLSIWSAAFLGAASVNAAPAPVSDTRYPYKGPPVPVGDWADQSTNGNGNGKGAFQRLNEPPIVQPSSSNPTNNINVVSLAYTANGVNVHFQTPFGIGGAPQVKWGKSSSSLTKTATGKTVTYDRTPPCSQAVVTLCSQYFHDVELTNLDSATTYYYQIPGGNGTTPSQVLSFTSARYAGDSSPFTFAVINDMGYTNAGGTYNQLSQAVSNGNVNFVWHGGDLSYADDWAAGVFPCAGNNVCYKGSSSTLPNTPPAPFPSEYNTPLPANEIPDQGGPQGGDMSVIYETNWDLWQNWMNGITAKVPYMVVPGNHEATCAEFDVNGLLASYLNNAQANTTSTGKLTYYSCPASQRNFTAYQNRFNMQGKESGGNGNFWYSFNYGLVHFISLDSETDFAYSPSWPFIRDVAGGKPTPSQTYVNDAGPFGYIDNNAYKDNSAYEQIQWLQNDLANIDYTATPWVIAMSHRPMFSSLSASYQTNVQNAFQSLLMQAGVDLYLAGHIHWYERMFPLTSSGAVDQASVVNSNTYKTNPGKSITHITNGAAGNIESHTAMDPSKVKNITAFLNQYNYGYGQLTVYNSTTLGWKWIKGEDGSVADSLTLQKST